MTGTPRQGPTRESMGCGVLRLGMRFYAVPQSAWLRLSVQSVRPPLASPSAAGLEVDAELWVEAQEPIIRPVREQSFVPGAARP